MWKLISLIIAIMFFSIFFIQNMVKVPVRFIVTGPVEIRLSYLLLTSFVIGCILFMVLYVSKEAKRRSVGNKKALSEYELDDEFEDE